MRGNAAIILLGLAFAGCGGEPGTSQVAPSGGATAPVAKPDGPVVATVGNGFVTEEMFATAASATISPGQELTPEQRAEVLDELIDDEILFQEAIEKGMYRDEKVRKILVNLLVREEVYSAMKDADIPDDDGEPMP